MPKGNWLGRLQVCEARHDGINVLFGERQQGFE